MFLDLHRGILELFADAQRAEADASDQRRETSRARIQSMRSDRRERVREEVATMRALLRRTKWEPPRPMVEVTACDRCGSPVERRQGCKAAIYHPCRPQAEAGGAATS